MRITNQNIYDKIVDVEEKLRTLEVKNDSSHLDILLHQTQTNGKVKLNRWIATTALTTLISAIIIYIGIATR